MQGTKPEVRTYNTILSACNRSGQPEHALRVYERMLADGAQPTATTYTALISAYGKTGKVRARAIIPSVSPCPSLPRPPGVSRIVPHWVLAIYSKPCAHGPAGWRHVHSWGASRAIAMRKFWRIPSQPVLMSFAFRGAFVFGGGSRENSDGVTRHWRKVSFCVQLSCFSYYTVSDGGSPVRRLRRRCGYSRTWCGGAASAT